MTGSGAAQAAESFGKYRKIAVLGRGGMATVYLAAAQGPGGFTKLAVVKELRPELAEDPEFMAKFLDEARLAAMLSHPNVVQTFEVLTDGDQHLIVMEYLEGQPLSRVRSKLAELGEIGVVAQLRIICDALSGLHYAHELTDYEGRPLGVVHRDMSPHNLFVTYRGEAKVIDFGIAKAADASSLTRTGIIKGKLAYMSPEQAGGKSVDIDRRADVFAAGVIVWEAAAGQRMWAGIEEMGILHRLATGDIPRLRDVRPGVSPVLDEICRHALAPDAAGRTPTAEALRCDLEQYMETTKRQVSVRDVGELVTRAFAEDRQKIKAVVDTQLRALRAASSEAHAVPLAQLGPAHSGSAGTGGSAATFGAVSMLSSPHVSTSQAPAQPRRRTGLWVGIAAAFAIGAVVAVGVTVAAKSGFGIGSEPTVPARSASAAGAGSVPATAASAPRTITLAVITQPAQATVTLDGKPFSGPKALAADGLSHELRVEARGYEPRVEPVVFDQDRAVPIILEKKKAHGPQLPRPPASGTVEDPLGF